MYKLILKVQRKRVVKNRDSVVYCRSHTRKIEKNYGRSERGSWARFSFTRKYNFLLAFFTTLLTWVFQVKLSLIVIPSNLALLTTSISLPSIDTGLKVSGFRANEILNSLHLSGFRTTLFLRDHSINSSVIPWALLAFPF